jgi:hypothetical protein
MSEDFNDSLVQAAFERGQSIMRERCALLVDFRAFKFDRSTITPESLIRRGQTSEAIRAIEIHSTITPESLRFTAATRIHGGVKMTICPECREETMPGELCSECGKCLECCRCHEEEEGDFAG